jgi:hypothetical protein
MEKKIIFTFALLAILCMINAFPHHLHKRTTSFEVCSPINGTDIPLLNVTISPDPVIPLQNTTFFINGTLTTPITSDLELHVAFLNQTSLIAPPFTAQLPLGAVVVNEVEQVPIPSLSSFYTIIVFIGNDPTLPTVVVGCAMVSVGG